MTDDLPCESLRAQDELLRWYGMDVIQMLAETREISVREAAELGGVLLAAAQHCAATGAAVALTLGSSLGGRPGEHYWISS